MTTLVEFLRSVDCPTLVLSYEETFLHPEATVRTLMDFAQFPLSDCLLDQLVGLIHPEDSAYARTAARSFTGNIDGIFDGHLFGWCREEGESRAVSLDLLVNGVSVQTVRADGFRNDCATPVSATAVMALIPIPPLQYGPRSYPRRARLRPHFPASGQRQTRLALCALNLNSAVGPRQCDFCGYEQLPVVGQAGFSRSGGSSCRPLRK